MPPPNDTLTTLLATSQLEQTRLLRELSVGMARVEEKLETQPVNEGRQDKRLDALESRVEVLYEDRTKARTVVSVLSVALAAVGTAVGWLLGK